MDNHFLRGYEEIARLWEQRITDNGAIYYKSSGHQISWTHPYLEKVLKDTDNDFAGIKYAAYRTALKVRTLQLQLGLSYITIDAIKKAFPVHDEQATSITNNDYTHEQALMLVKIAVYTSDVESRHVDVHNKVAELILALIVQIYDKSHSGKLISRCIQNALVAMCGARLGEKYKFFCSRNCDHEGKLSRDKLILLIDDLMQIPTLLRESKAFGVDVVAAVDSCFGTSENKGIDSVSQSCFYAWLFLEPQTLVWLPTLHRAVAAEKVRHDAQCSCCKIHPINGFRYRCLLCLGYSLCQNCFLLGQHSLSHTLHHPVKEYCLPMTALDNTKVWLITVKNRLFCRRGQQTETAYLPVLERTDQRVVLDWEYGSIQVDQMASLGPLDPGFDLDTDSMKWEDNEKQTSKQESDTGNVNEGDETCTQARIPLTLLGHQADSNAHSSGSLEPKPLFSQEDCEEYKAMAFKIEELQQENRILMEKLQAYERHSEIQRSSKEKCSTAEAVKDATTESFISPIAEISRNGACLMGNMCGKSDQNTLAIIGAFTPVRGPPSASLLANPPPSMPHGNVTDETEADGLQYRSSDMSLLSRCEESGEHTQNKESSHSAAASNHQSAIADNDLASYKPSDMSRLCLGLGKLSVKEDVEIINKSHSDDGEVLPDSSFDDSRMTESKVSKHEHIQGGLLSRDSVTPLSVELSNIHSGSISHGLVKLPSFLPTPNASARKGCHRMLEPVHMSTPVHMLVKKARCLDEFSISASQKAQISASTTNDKTHSENQENLPPLGGTPIVSSSDMKTENLKSGCVLSPNSLLREHPCQQNSLDSQKLTTTDKKELFDRDQKASWVGDSHIGFTHQKSELHQILSDFEKECKISDISDNNTRLMTANNSSVLAAAFSIGDVLAEFVQAVTKQDNDCNVSEATETTHF